MSGDRLMTAVGFLLATVVIGALVWVSGVDAVLATLAEADLGVVALMALVATGWLTAWGLSLWTVLAALGTPVRAHTAVVVYSGAVFANNVTPFGQAGGEPITAMLVAAVTESEYERGLAAIASVDALHFVPSIGFALAGLGVLGVSAARLGRNLVAAAAVVLALAIAVPVGIYLGWRYRHELESVVGRVVTPVVRWLVGLVPGQRVPAAQVVRTRVGSFFAALDRVGADRRRLAVALGFSALGWAGLVTSLWLALYALGHAVPVSAVLLAIPLGSVAAVTPLPGGAGALETVLAAILVPTAQVSPAVATSAVLLHRVWTFWLPTLVGGGVVAAVGVDYAVVSE